MVQSFRSYSHLRSFFFLINIVRYFFLSPSDEGREKGKKALFWGLIGLVVLFCVWGVVTLLLATLNTLTTATPTQTTTTQTSTQTTPGQPLVPTASTQ